jgi:hypothetical protein
MRISSNVLSAVCGALALILLAACGREAPEPEVVEGGIAMDADDIAGSTRGLPGS